MRKEQNSIMAQILSGFLMSNSSVYSTKQRGSGFGIKIVYLFFRLFGYCGLHFILIFVVFYFTLTTPTIKRNLKEYYMLCTGKFNYFVYYKHIYTFSLIFADRIFSKKFIDRYKVTISKNSHVMKDESAGILLLLSHLGDWSLSSSLPSIKNKIINVVMKEEVKDSIIKLENNISTTKKVEKVKIIDLSQGMIYVAVKLADAFANNELVAMMADRYLSKESSVDVTLFGKNVRINKNPFDVAYNRKANMIVFFAIRDGAYRYSSFYFKLEPFDMSVSKDIAISKKAQEYAIILEDMSRKYPNQWLNHYNFFES